MKTIVLNILKALVLATTVLGLANCSKGGNNNSVSGIGAYQLANGVCYQNINGQLIPQANTALCSGTGYQMINNICYQNVNGQYVQQPNTALCLNNANGVGGYCSGYYTDGNTVAQCTENAVGTTYTQAQTPWGMRQVIVMDCTGYTLQSSAGVTARCL